MRARIGISGSSISTNRRSTPSSRSDCSSEGRTARDAEGLEPGDGDRRQPRGGRRQDEVQPLRDDVGDLLGPQRRVDEVGGDLGVERHRQRRRVRLLREPAVSSGLTSWPTSGIPSASSSRRSASEASRALGRDHPAVGPGDRERRAAAPASGRGSSTTSPIPTAGLAAEPRLEPRDAVHVDDLDPARVLDRGRERARQVARRRSRRPRTAPPG